MVKHISHAEPFQKVCSVMAVWSSRACPWPYNPYTCMVLHFEALRTRGASKIICSSINKSTPGWEILWLILWNVGSYSNPILQGQTTPRDAVSVLPPSRLGWTHADALRSVDRWPHRPDPCTRDGEAKGAWGWVTQGFWWWELAILGVSIVMGVPPNGCL